MVFSDQHITRHTNLDSTNLEAWRLIKSGRAIEGSVILTSYQTAGKGQDGAIWESEKGKNLMFSWILKPGFLLPSEQFMLTKTTSIALQETISGYLDDYPVKIKWPNDIYVGQRKIAGILIENAIMGNHIEFSVIGIGINVNQTKFRSGAPNPVSLKQLTGKEIKPGVCLKMFGNSLNKWYQILKNEGTELIDYTYIKHLLGYGTIMQFKDNERFFRARISGISKYGRLIIDENESIREYDMKEISFV